MLSFEGTAEEPNMGFYVTFEGTDGQFSYEEIDSPDDEDDDGGDLEDNWDELSRDCSTVLSQ